MRRAMIVMLFVALALTGCAWPPTGSLPSTTSCCYNPYRVRLYERHDHHEHHHGRVRS